ncbi:MAG: trypsin-like serine protease [Planctomycetota bacterium]
MRPCIAAVVAPVVVPLVAALVPPTAAVRAQEPPTPVFQPYTLDSGPVDHVPGGAAVVPVGDVHVPGTSSLQLWIGAFALPGGSRLRLTGVRDGAVQWFSARSLRDYQQVSAFFNGDRVRVELLPAAGTASNRVVVTKVRIGEAAATTEGICGASDTRVLSSDPRVGRIGSCCTTFLVDERNLVTAGHCLGGTGGAIVHFNVPLSDAGGAAQYPPPDDQYALLAGSLTSVNGGLGNDYAVVATVRNSNTGRYPGEAQGSWFAPTPVPPGPAPMQWTVTGYGTTAVNPTWSLAQKSLTGPRQTQSSALLQFFITVTGCNSGSPVIGSNGTDVHGVVTHAGCGATSGSNYGTGLGLGAFQLALQGLQRSTVAGTFGTFGTGCGGAAGTPQLLPGGTPDLGSAVTLTVSGLEPGGDRFGLLLLGTSDTDWNGTPLPLDLAPLAMDGCALRVEPLLSYALSTGFGTAQLTLPIPGQPEFLGAALHAQHFAHDPTAANAAQVVASNGVRIRLGN